MKPNSFWLLTQAGAMLLAALTTAGCQSIAGPQASTAPLTQTIPGKMARERHAHVIAASDKFADALSGQKALLNDIAFDHKLTDSIAASNHSNNKSAKLDLRLLANTQVIERGPYQLVQADTWNGRLEYRSSYNGSHLVVTVRPPEPQELKAGHPFIVTDLFGQVSLSNLTTMQLVKPIQVSHSSSDVSTPLLRITPLAGETDRDRLGYLDSLPMIERDRADIMAIRTLLMMRMGDDNEASKLVQQGIIRFPDIPVYFTLANLLFVRANNSDIDNTDTLSSIMRERFSSVQIRKSQQQVLLFLNQAAAI